ncbi:ABC transporter ATP-binding protein [Allokutzneria oryzae]|uniref:ABC transporter ATP-binding protein n=1 Tax=Allokutzneria oryzae TaxID=1378989 RepID=A0ABV5ZUY8_9PSEU
MIEVRGLTKRYRDVVAVDDLSFTVSPGRVTGFLGPNGAGKSTTMRMILGLDTPTAGSAHVGGRNYRSLAAPLREVGALLDPAALQKSRTARAHLRWIAQAGGIEQKRVGEVLELVGLGKAGDKRVGEFSLGMRQRLGIAAALLGDPAVLMLDEPLNGLDPEGIVWVRTLLKGLASEGRTIFLSSHLMNEMEATADHVLVIGKGKLIADVSVHDLVRQGVAAQVSVVSPKAADLLSLLGRVGAHVVSSDGNELILSGVEAAQIGELAAQHGIPLHELTPRRPGLEEAFIHLTRDQVGYRAQATSAAKEHQGS